MFGRMVGVSALTITIAYLTELGCLGPIFLLGYLLMMGWWHCQQGGDFKENLTVILLVYIWTVSIRCSPANEMTREQLVGACLGLAAPLTLGSVCGVFRHGK
jgi:hypothetical protein